MIDGVDWTELLKIKKSGKISCAEWHSKVVVRPTETFSVWWSHVRVKSRVNNVGKVPMKVHVRQWKNEKKKKRIEKNIRKKRDSPSSEFTTVVRLFRCEIESGNLGRSRAEVCDAWISAVICPQKSIVAVDIFFLLIEILNLAPTSASEISDVWLPPIYS